MCAPWILGKHHTSYIPLARFSSRDHTKLQCRLGNVIPAKNSFAPKEEKPGSRIMPRSCHIHQRHLAAQCSHAYIFSSTFNILKCSHPSQGCHHHVAPNTGTCSSFSGPSAARAPSPAPLGSVLFPQSHLSVL